MYSQVVVTDDCNLTCSYCDEYTPGAPVIPLEELKARIDKLDELGVLVYDFLGGETLLHPDIAALIRHVKSKRGGSNLATIITNGFLLTEKMIRDLNDAGLDFMQVSIDSIEPTDISQKSLKSVLPRLRLLAKEAKFQVEIQTVLSEDTLRITTGSGTWSRTPFAFGFSIQHGPGKSPSRGEVPGPPAPLRASRGQFLRPSLEGNAVEFLRPWKCLAGFKFLYLNSQGAVQWCAQQRNYRYPLERMDLEQLRFNNRHKPCEAGCSLGCVRMVSHTLGEPLKTFGASLRLALGMFGSNKEKKTSKPVPPPVVASR